MKKVRTAADEISIDENGIVHKRVLEGTHIEAHMVIETENVCKALTGKARYLMLVDATALHTMTPEALEELKKALIHNRIATAVHSHRTGIRILVDYLAKADPAVTPVQLFQEREKVLEWLLQFKHLAQ